MSMYESRTDWNDKLNELGREILLDLGHYDIPSDSNPITDALAGGDFVTRFKDKPGFNKFAVSFAATICQMAVYDASGGPDGDGKAKGLRRQWYSWYKTRFAQPFSSQLADVGDEKESTGFDGTGWAGRMSKTYGVLVDEHGLTYKDLWVDDASRMIERMWRSLFEGFHVMLAVEKDSLFGDFKDAARALGAKSLVSGKGKQSKAATEKVLREHFDWTPGYDPFTKEEPLIVLHISDHDMDGEKVIGPTFGEQARRYTPWVLEARVGIKPEMVDDPKDSWYEVKSTNNGYVKWAEEKALFLAECGACGHTWVTVGASGEWGEALECPECYSETALTVATKKDPYGSTPYGFEVEALPTRAYYRAIVETLLTVVPLERILSRLRDECTADAHIAADRILAEVLEKNESYQRLLDAFKAMEEAKEEFEHRVKEMMSEAGRPHEGDWRGEEEDPKAGEFAEYVERASSWSDPWQPFDVELRTGKLVALLQEDEAEQIQGFKNETIKW